MLKKVLALVIAAQLSHVALADNKSTIPMTKEAAHPGKGHHYGHDANKQQEKALKKERKEAEKAHKKHDKDMKKAQKKADKEAKKANKHKNKTQTAVTLPIRY